MTLLAPLTAAIIGIVGGVALLLLYALRSRRRIVLASTTAHWPTIDDDTQASEPFRLPKVSWLLLLHALILALFALAAGRPAITGIGENADRIIILDASASMRALDPDGTERFERARTLARTTAQDTISSGGRIALVSLDGAPALLTGFTQSAATLNAALDALQPTDEAEAPAALRPLLDGLLANTDEAADRGRIITLINDRLATPTELSMFTIDHRSIAPANQPRNLGITRFTATRRTEDPGEVRILLELIATQDNESAIVILTLNDTELQRIPLSFDESRTARRVFTLPVSGGLLSATLQGTDALAADNAASVIIAPGRPLTIGLVRRFGPTASVPASAPRDTSWVLEETLNALPRVTVTPIDLARLRASDPTSLTNIDVLVFDGLPKPADITTPALLLGNARLSTAESTPPSRETILLWERTDPLLTGLSLDGIFGVPTLTPLATSLATSLARSATQPLVWRTEQPRTIAIAFSSADTNWPLDVSFPVLIARSIEWLAGTSQDARGASFKAGEVVALGAALPRRFPRAGVFAKEWGGDGMRISPPLEPIVPVDALGSIAVNVADAGESSLPLGEPIDQTNTPQASGSGAFKREIWSWFLAAAAALLVLEWFVFAARTRIKA